MGLPRQPNAWYPRSSIFAGWVCPAPPGLVFSTPACKPARQPCPLSQNGRFVLIDAAAFRGSSHLLHSRRWQVAPRGGASHGDGGQHRQAGRQLSVKLRLECVGACTCPCLCVRELSRRATARGRLASSAHAHESNSHLGEVRPAAPRCCRRVWEDQMCGGGMRHEDSCFCARGREVWGGVRLEAGPDRVRCASRAPRLEGLPNRRKATGERGEDAPGQLTARRGARHRIGGKGGVRRWCVPARCWRLAG